MAWDDSNYLNKGFIDEVDGALDRWGGSGGGSGGGSTQQLDALISRTITEVKSDAESVGDYACHGSTNLAKVDFSKATSIGNSAFTDCNALNEFIMRSETVCKLSNDTAFNNTPIREGDGHIYVPSALLSKYKVSAEWYEFSKRFRALEDYTADGTVTGRLDPEKTSQPDPTYTVVLDVEKITSDTYAAETTYSSEEFILINVYFARPGTITVTYGGLTKTITDSVGFTRANPVFFGTFNGVTDSVATPSSGTLTISGDFKTFGCGTFAPSSKKSSMTCNCITNVVDWGGVSIIPEYAFYTCSKLTNVTIPECVAIIERCAFGAMGDPSGFSVTFENASGWWVNTSNTATSGTSMDVSDPAQNASNLMLSYSNYYWKCF